HGADRAPADTPPAALQDTAWGTPARVRGPGPARAPPPAHRALGVCRVATRPRAHRRPRGGGRALLCRALEPGEAAARRAPQCPGGRTLPQGHTGGQPPVCPARAVTRRGPSTCPRPTSPRPHGPRPGGRNDAGRPAPSPPGLP